jgi:hypothetical protein
MAVVPVWDDAGATYPSPTYAEMHEAVTIAPASSSLIAVRVLKNDLTEAASGDVVTGFVVMFRGTLGPPPAAVQTIGRDILYRRSPSLVPISRAGAAATMPVQFSRHIRLRLQDQDLARAGSAIALLPRQFVLSALGKNLTIRSPMVRPNGYAVDPKTNVVSLSLSAPRPTPLEVSQVRSSVLSILSIANSPRTTP